jgi:hypothetical protein
LIVFRPSGTERLTVEHTNRPDGTESLRIDGREIAVLTPGGQVVPTTDRLRDAKYLALEGGVGIEASELRRRLM